MNGNDSSLSVEEESDLIRAALIMSDKVGIACKNSEIFNVDNFMISTNDKVNLKYLRNNIGILLRSKPDEQNYFYSVFDEYKSLLNRRRKSKSQVLRMLTVKKYIDEVRNWAKEVYKEASIENKIDELVPFATCKKNVIIVRFFGNSSQNNVDLAINVLKSKDDFIIFYKPYLEDLFFSDLNETGKNTGQYLNNTSSPVLLTGFIAAVPIFRGLSFNHYKLVRENFNSGTVDFRNSLLNTRETFNNTLFAKKNIQVFAERYLDVKQNALSFEKLVKESVLLNNLSASGAAMKIMKISFAVTSYEGLISILAKLKIINERESLYVKEGISRIFDPAMSIAFLIAEDEDK